MDYEKQGADFAEKWGVNLKVLGKRYAKYFDWDDECRWVFKLRLSRGRKSYTFEFGQSIFNGDAEPTMYDVLSCIEKYNPDDFETFCGSYGYDEDSRKAYKIYKACVREYDAVCRLFGDSPECMEELWDLL